ncbi:MAG TPA: MAPEG family protein [Burkholderiaceae bacterium]|nr:MAPEG family protein [Burkholderiaceae bacterium]
MPEIAGHAVGDKAARQRFLARSIWLTVPGTYLLLWGAYALVPPLHGLEETNARLVLAVRWLPVAMIPYAAVCIVILAARFFEGAHNPLVGGESERLRIHVRVMQNTLEQLVWFALCVVPLATYVTPAQARLVPIVCTFFALARFVYWWGYLRSGTLGRAPGVQLTFSLNIALLVLVLVLFVRHIVS